MISRVKANPIHSFTITFLNVHTFRNGSGKCKTISQHLLVRDLRVLAYVRIVAPGIFETVGKCYEVNLNCGFFSQIFGQAKVIFLDFPDISEIHCHNDATFHLH